MSGVILHHYQTSPFSEKVRLVLGLKRLAWRSVIVPVMLPKPDVVALTGGYRRTPFMQIGADVYCDSALMCRVLDALAPEPPLYPAASAGIDAIVAQWADSALFWAAIPFTLQPAGAAHIFAGAPAEFLKAFGADRAAMTASMRRPPSADAGAALRTYLARLEALLADSRPFLLGALPCIADVSAAQAIWFMRRAPPIAEVLRPYAKLVIWYERVASFGHGTQTPMTSDEAIAVARAATTHVPLSFAPGQGFAEGDEVSVTPADYAHDAVHGRVVGLSDDAVVLERGDERAGTVHVHFPRVGFHIRAQVEKKDHP